MNKKLEKLVTKIPGWLSHNEAQFLIKAVTQTEKLKGEIVEIGSFCGKSTICLAQSNGNVYAIDPHKGDTGEEQFFPTYKKFRANLKKANVGSKVKPLITTSQLAAKSWNKKIRMLFIDGLHDEKNALQDFELWSKHVVPGGIIAIHDSFRKWCGSEKVALKHIVQSEEFYSIGVIDSITYGIKGSGNRRDKALKLLSGMYIRSMITLEHMRIMLFNFPSISKRMFFSKPVQQAKLGSKLVHVLAFSEFFNHLFIERGNIIGLT